MNDDIEREEREGDNSEPMSSARSLITFSSGQDPMTKKKYQERAERHE